MEKLPEPIKVSPLIKFFRYSFLIVGIFYGATKLKTLQVIEAGRKEEKERLKAEKQAKLAAERKAASERDIAEIVAIFSEKPEPRFTVEEQNCKEVVAKETANTNVFEELSNKVDISEIQGNADTMQDDSEIFSKGFDLSDTINKKNIHDDVDQIMENNENLQNEDDVEFKGQPRSEAFDKE